MSEPVDEEEPQPSARDWMLAVTVFYALVLVAEFVVVHWREEFPLVSRALFVEQPEWRALLIALPCAIAGTAYATLCSRMLKSVRAVEDKLARTCGGASDLQIAGVAMLAAVTEALFLRFWMQEWRGYGSAVAIAVGFGVGPGIWALWPVHLGIAAMLSGIVAAGFGLAASALAHALILYWSLRRILAP